MELELIKAEQKSREFFNSHSKQYKQLNHILLVDKLVTSFMDIEENYNVKYAIFTEKGAADIGFLPTVEEAIIAATLNLGINDDRVLNMIMSAKREA